MLVVTFGRAASQELRERVRDQLVEAERGARATREPRDPATTALHDWLLDAGRRRAAPAPRPADRDALADFDAATIATIHQFCQLVLRSLGVAGDTDAGRPLVEDLDELVVEVVDDLYLARFAARTQTPPCEPRRGARPRPRRRRRPARAGLEPPTCSPSARLAGRRGCASPAVLDEVDRRKRRLGVLSYDDLLSRLADALADTTAPARARMRRPVEGRARRRVPGHRPGAVAGLRRAPSPATPPWC